VYPLIEINIGKLKHNVNAIVKLCNGAGIKYIFGVTKVLAGNLKAMETVINSGITHIAESRIENLMLVQESSLPKLLLRLPM
jgi:predicted amino acid racemase